MKKKLSVFTLALLLCLTLCFACACKKRVNYFDSVSENRYSVYIYKDDSLEVKIYCSDKESPYCADGVKSDMNPTVEFFASFTVNPEKVSINCQALQGEMNYRAVQNDYYLNFTAQGFTDDKVKLTLEADGESKEIEALSVVHEGVMTAENALKCVTEHDKELFESLTQNNLFCGEIFIRLLFDEDCYYFIGVCDRQGDISDYLLDGLHGKIIATKKLNA